MPKEKNPKRSKLLERFLRIRWVRVLLVWAKRRSLTGFMGVPIYDVLVFVFNEFRRFDLIQRANAISFSFFLSIFPGLISLFTLIPYFKTYFLRFLPEGSDFDESLRESIQDVMPGVAGARMYQFIEDITSNPRTGLFSFGFLLTVFFASNGMLAVMRSFEKSYSRTYKSRNFFRKRFIAITLSFAAAGLIIFSVVLSIVGGFVIRELGDLTGLDRLTLFLLNAIRWIIVLFLAHMAISMIYRYGAPLRQRFRWFTPGSLVATLLCALASAIFSTYVNNFGMYNELYGSIGAIIVIMLWMQLNAISLLIGYELNASIAVNRDLKKTLDKEDSVF